MTRVLRASTRNLKLNWSLRLLLQHDGATCNTVAVTNVPHVKFDKITCSQLAVDPQIEQCKVANAFLHLKANAYRPYVLGTFSGSFWPTSLPLFQASRE